MFLRFTQFRLAATVATVTALASRRVARLTRNAMPYRHLFLCAFCLVSISSVGRAAEAPPNILFILVDDVGREVLECYGGQSYRTPNINDLASRGMRFDNAYVMPMCHPTRTCILTGQYPFRLGEMPWGTFPKQFETKSLPNLLKQSGYVTGIAGKWQLTLLKNDPAQPNRMGFDEYCLDAWHEGPWYYQPRIWQNGKLRDDLQDRYGPDVTCDYLVDFLHRRRSERFFAFYTMELCHDETNDLDKPAPFGPLGRYENYAEMVAQMDKRIARVMSTLDSLALREKTLVLFLSDNGTPPRYLGTAKDGRYVFQPFTSTLGGREITGGKGKLTDWGTRVPMILNWPGKIKAGSSTDALVDASDILPTLAEIAGVPVSGGELKGHSISPVLAGGVGTRKWVFMEYNGKACARGERWKLYTDGRLFDLKSDPDELSPIDTRKVSDNALSAYQDLSKALDEVGYGKAQR